VKADKRRRIVFLISRVSYPLRVIHCRGQVKPPIPRHEVAETRPEGFSTTYTRYLPPYRRDSLSKGDSTRITLFCRVYGFYRTISRVSSTRLSSASAPRYHCRRAGSLSIFDNPYRGRCRISRATAWHDSPSLTRSSAADFKVADFASIAVGIEGHMEIAVVVIAEAGRNPPSPFALVLRARATPASTRLMSRRRSSSATAALNR
jgi:hypothetical protein